MSVSRRALSEGEIRILESRGCSAQDWSKVTVADGFDPLKIKNVTFSGEVSLGRFDGVFHRPGGLERPAATAAAIPSCSTISISTFLAPIPSAR